MTTTLRPIATGFPGPDDRTSQHLPTSVAELLALLDSELQQLRARSRRNSIRLRTALVHSSTIARDPITRLAPDFPLQTPGPRWQNSVAGSIAPLFGCAVLFDARGSNNILLFGTQLHRPVAARMITTGILAGEELSVVFDAERLRRLVSRDGCAGTDSYRRGWLLGYADQVAKHCRDGWDVPEQVDIRVLARLAARSAHAASSGTIASDPVDSENPCFAAGRKAGQAAGMAIGARQGDLSRFDC